MKVICLHYRPSRQLQYYVYGLHGVLFMIILTIHNKALAQILLTGMVLGSAIHCYRHYFVITDDSIATVILNSKDEWILQTQKGMGLSAQLLAGSVCLSWLTVLVFACTDGHRRSLILLSDNTDPEAFRRLRIRLHYPMRAD